MKRQYNNLEQLARDLKADPSLQDMFREDPVQAIQEIIRTPLETDVWIYRIVVCSLGLCVVATIIGILLLVGNGQVDNDQGVPTILTAIGSAAIGALAGLLAPSPKNNINS